MLEAWIKNVGLHDNYPRYGKTIPRKETKVDLMKFFGNRDEKALVASLKSDKNISFKAHRP